MPRITPFLTFKEGGKDALEFYAGIFKNSKVNSSFVMPGNDKLLHASFTLDGQEFMAMDGGESFSFAFGASMFVSCEGQEEVDYYWDKLSEGGEPGQCGWLKDKFGLSWQIVPTALGQLMGDPDPAKAMRVRDAMLKMTKIIIADLQKAHDGQ